MTYHSHLDSLKNAQPKKREQKEIYIPTLSGLKWESVPLELIGLEVRGEKNYQGLSETTLKPTSSTRGCLGLEPVSTYKNYIEILFLWEARESPSLFYQENKNCILQKLRTETKKKELGKKRTRKESYIPMTFLVIRERKKS